MTQNELASELRNGSITLTLDTNVISGGSNRFSGFIKITQQIKQLNSFLDLSRQVRICVSALAHMEVLFDLRQVHGQRYDADLVASGLVNAGVLVESFTETHSDKAADYLGKCYPTNGQWNIAKQLKHAAHLGIPIQPTATRCLPATIDWPIAAQADADGYILITDDKGVEFERAIRKATAEILRGALDDVLSQPTHGHA